jgi:hypothetical protein
VRAKEGRGQEARRLFVRTTCVLRLELCSVGVGRKDCSCDRYAWAGLELYRLFIVV